MSPQPTNTRGSNGKSSKRLTRTSEPADWATQRADVILALITAVSTTGGAVRFGYTRDGGAYAVGFYGDGEPYTEYIRPNEDVDAALLAMLELWRG